MAVVLFSMLLLYHRNMNTGQDTRYISALFVGPSQSESSARATPQNLVFSQPLVYRLRGHDFVVP